MSLASASSRMPPYTGNGVASAFSYTFKILSDSDLLVTKRLISTGVETTLALTTDYTVTGAGEAGGGTVTLVAGALSALYELHIRRVRPLTQTTSIRDEGDYFASTHETAFDKLAMVDQQQQDEIDRSLKLPETISPEDFDTTLPGLFEASRMLMISEDGLGFELGPTPDELTQASADASAAATSAAAAATSASAAAASATAAASSATAAAASATAAAASATAAAASAASAAAATEWTVTGSRGTPTAITAGGGITALTGLTRRELQFIQGSGGAVTVTANPQISAGSTVGQQLKLVGRSDTNTVTLADGTGLFLEGSWVAEAGAVLLLYWDGSVWAEVSRNF
jgi:hypothetical protein